MNLVPFFNAASLFAGVFKAFAVTEPEMIFRIIQLMQMRSFIKTRLTEIPQTSEELNYSSLVKLDGR